MGHYNTVLITPGSSGTNMLANLVGIEKLNNGKKNYDRHRRDPDIKGVDKIIYMYSNPYDMIISFHKRGFFNDLQHCKNMYGDVEGLKEKLGCSLEEYLKFYKDFFKIEDHFFSYYNYEERKYDIMFVKYESIQNNIPFVLKWLNSEHKEEEFVFKKRNSNWKEQPENIKNLLKNKFGDFYDFLDGLPDLFIFNEKEN